MADIKSLTATDIQNWFDQATPDQATQVLNPVLEKVADYPQAHRDRFVEQMTSRTKRLFQEQPVG